MTVSRTPVAQDVEASRPVRRGRPRDEGMDAAVLRAGWEVLGAEGYSGLTFEAVAERAGCSRPALYRRFSSRRDLLMAVLEASVRAYEPDLSEIRDPAAQLVGHLQGFVRYLAFPGGGAVLALSQARRKDAGLSEALDQLFAQERPFYARALNAAAGVELPEGFVHLLVDAMLGAVVFRVALRDAPMDLAEVEEIVAQAVRSARLGPAAPGG